jgi:hypothetical protein
MKKHIYFILILTIFFSCKKNPVTVDCNSIAAPSLSYAAVVEAGDSVKLNATVAGSPVSFFWNGPNGYSSNEKDATINPIESNGAGRYTLQVDYGNGCVKTVSTDSIGVLVPISPCTPPANSANLSDTAVASFNTITSSFSGSVYSIVANGVNGKITMQFLNTSRAPAGVYSIQPQGGTSKFGYVRFRYDAQGESWQASSGKIYVTITNNKISANFCQVKVSSLVAGSSITMTGNVTEP